MNITEQQIRTTSEDGAMDHAGFTWAQPIAWRERVIERTLYATTSAALITSPLFFMWVNDISKYKIDGLSFVILATFVISALAVVVWLTLLPFNFLNWAVESAAVTFTNGHEIWVTTPRRLWQAYALQEWACLRLEVSEITSIECVSMKNNSGGQYKHGGDDGYLAFNVCVYFMNGRRFFAATYLDESHASIVQAQLNIALREIRIEAARAA
jgi:hypothetical protein